MVEGRLARRLSIDHRYRKSSIPQSPLTPAGKFTLNRWQIAITLLFLIFSPAG